MFANLEYDGEMLSLQMNRGSTFPTVTGANVVTGVWDTVMHAERNRFGGGSVMIWGGITARHRTPLVVVQGNPTGVGYRDQILRPVVIPFLQRHGPGLTFQQDNARPHTARVAMDFLHHNNVMLLPWPAISPDLSPNEHVWDEMERRLRRLPHPPDNVRDLAQDLRRIWQAIPQAFQARLVDSMRRRCTAVIHTQGGHTRY